MVCKERCCHIDVLCSFFFFHNVRRDQWVCCLLCKWKDGCRLLCKWKDGCRLGSFRVQYSTGRVEVDACHSFFSPSSESCSSWFDKLAVAM